MILERGETELILNKEGTLSGVQKGTHQTRPQGRLSTLDQA